jgi:hypothetical protein
MKSLLAAGLALAIAQSASAAVIVVNGNFTATDWDVYFGEPSAPIDPLSMSYTVTFDDALTYEADTTLLTILGSNNPYPVTFSYSPSFGVIVIATDGDVGGCSHPAETFCAFVSDFATGTPFFVEQSPAGGGGWVAGTITGGAPGIPEPTSWGLMIAGFGLAGTALRRRTAAHA